MTAIILTDPTLIEIATTLKEWHQIWISLYLENQSVLFESLSSLICQVIDLKINLYDLLITKQQCEKQAEIESSLTIDVYNKSQLINDVKLKIITKLDYGNKLLNLYLVLRNENHEQIEPGRLSPLALYKLHVEAFERIQSMTNNQQADNIYNHLVQNDQQNEEFVRFNRYVPSNDSNKTVPFQSISTHLQLSLKEHQLTIFGNEDMFEVHLALAIQENLNLQITTDKFIIRLRGDKILNTTDTVFTNIGSMIDRTIYLYVQVYRIGPMTYIENNKTQTRISSNTNQPINQDGSNQSINNPSYKYAPNGLSNNSKQPSNYSTHQASFRRPFGSTLVNLCDIIKNSDNELSVRVPMCNEVDFSLMDELIGKKQQSLKTISNSSLQLTFSVRQLQCNEESIPNFCTFQPLVKTEKKGFPDIIMPGDFKNDLYLCLDKGDFDKGGKSIPKNIEATISLIDKTGIAIQNCISSASNYENVTYYKSAVFYHSNSPRWNETLKINIPLSEFDSAHIRIEFRHCSSRDKEKKFLGFSFLPLSDKDGAIISNRSHELYLYKCDWKDELVNMSGYLNSPYGPSDDISMKSSNNYFTHSNREIINVSTYLLSTKLTQNRNLLNLLRWRELVKKSNDELEYALLSMLNLPGEEIVKFLQDILDTLFDTFTVYSDSNIEPKNNYVGLIFKVLIQIFMLIEDPKFRHFQQVLDTYVSAHFSATLVYRGLLQCVKQCVDYSSNKEKQTQMQIQKCFKNLKYIFQFVVQSNKLYLKATGEQSDHSFLSDLSYLFKSFEQILSSTDRELVGIQVTILESFPGTFKHLIKVLGIKEIVNIIDTLLSPISGCELPPQLLKAKLIFMRETISEELLRNQDARFPIVEMFSSHLEFHMQREDYLDLCQEIFSGLIKYIHEYYWPPLYSLFETVRQLDTNSNIPQKFTVEEIKIYILEVENNLIENELNSSSQIYSSQVNQILDGLSTEIDPLMSIVDIQIRLLEKAIKDTNSKNLDIQKFCVDLLTIFKLMNSKNYEQYWRNRNNYCSSCDLFKAFRGIFNHDWLIMQLTTTAILEYVINGVAKSMCLEINLKNLSTNKQLISYFKLVVDFITYPALQIETLSSRKKNLILTIFGDMRFKFSEQMVTVWHKLDSMNIYALLPALISSIMDVTLLSSDKFQKQLIPTFYDMMDAEYELKSDFSQLTRCFVDNIEVFMNLDRGSRAFLTNFETILLDCIERKNPNWKSKGIALVDSLKKLIEYLINYRCSLSNTDNMNWTMHCLVDLINYYKDDHDRADLYGKYVFKLSQIHIKNGNHVEAGMTLKLYSNTLDWCNRILPAMDGYHPEEPEWVRKESIYNRIIDYLDLAECWEEAIDLCKDLAFFYERWPDYEKLSLILKRLANFFDNILTKIRLEREYFRVEFLGTESPEFLRGKELVFRGKECERLPTFMQRMADEFPNASVLNPISKLNYTKESVGNYLVISNVKPKPCLNDSFKLSRPQSDKIIAYYLNNRVDIFSYDKPLIKQVKNIKLDERELELRTRWVERTILKLPRQLPSILPWCEVCDSETMEVPPIHHAIETISNMNLELTKLILSYKNDASKHEPQQISFLTMRLQGIIEGAVNGGSALIIKTFLGNRNLVDGLEDEDFYEPQESVAKLYELMRQQISILEKGLIVHSKLASQEVLPLQVRLEERLEFLRNNLSTTLNDFNLQNATQSNNGTTDINGNNSQNGLRNLIDL